MRYTRAALTIPVSLALVAGVTACSSSKSGTGTTKSTSPSSTTTSSTPTTSSATPTVSGDAAAIAAKAVAYLKAVPAFRMQGSGTSDGQKLQLDYYFKGDNSAGSIALAGASFELRSVDKVVYFKPSNAFWTKFAGASAPTVIAKVGGKWLRVAKTDSNFSSFTDLADRSSFLSNALTSNGTPKLGTPKTVDGVPCLTLIDTSDNSTLYVAASDARPIEADNSGTDAGKLTITYSGVPTPTIPPASETIDSSAVGG